MAGDLLVTRGRPGEFEPFAPLTVERADAEVHATAELVDYLRAAGSIVEDILTIGTDGYGLGVVRYSVGGTVTASGYELVALTRV